MFGRRRTIELCCSLLLASETTVAPNVINGMITTRIASKVGR